MSATSGFLKKGSGEKYIKNRPYTANCAKRVREKTSKWFVTFLEANYFTVLDCSTVLNPVPSEEHFDV